MSKLTVPTLKTVALSEPVWLDDVVHFAAESPERDEIRVRRALINDAEGTLGLFTTFETLPGGPTDNGIRAMWPRMNEWPSAESIGVVYQRGVGNVLVDIAHPLTSFHRGRAFGIWPCATHVGAIHEAPSTQSQGVFGYLDAKWWTFDQIRQSAYAAAYPQGVLFHGWRNAQGVLHLLFNASGTPPDELDARVILCTDEGGTWHRSVVFTGIARYPRGVSLPDGRVYVHAVADDGQYLAALSPFEAMETPTMKPTVTILEGWPKTITLGASIPVAVLPVGADSASAYIEQGLQRVEVPVKISGELVHLTPPNDGNWNIRARAVNAEGVDESQSPRIVRVTAPPKGETPTITSIDLLDMESAIERIDEALVAISETLRPFVKDDDVPAAAQSARRWLARYATLRAAGQAHEPARDAVVAEVWEFVETEIAKAKATS